MAHLTLHHGPPYTPPWPTLHSTVAHLTLHRGPPYTPPWPTLHSTVAHLTLHRGPPYTPPWPTLHSTMAHLTLHRGPHYTPPWPTLHSTVAPLPSVSLPSSNSCSNTVNTSGCAFSTSSNSTTALGLLRRRPVSWPPSSCPMYPDVNIDIIIIIAKSVKAVSKMAQSRS